MRIHQCRCEDGAIVLCVCDAIEDHDEEGFYVDMGAAYTAPTEDTGWPADDPEGGYQL